MKFSIKDFFSKCDQIRSFQRIWSHLLKKCLMENFNFCAMSFFGKYCIYLSRTTPCPLFLQSYFCIDIFIIVAFIIAVVIIVVFTCDHATRSLRAREKTKFFKNHYCNSHPYLELHTYAYLPLASFLDTRK